MNLDLTRAIVHTLPHVMEDVKWGNLLCFCVAGKMFCVTDVDDSTHISLKVTGEEFEELLERTGFMPAPYLARNKWVRIDSSANLSRKELQRLVTQSYELVKAKLPRSVREKLTNE